MLFDFAGLTFDDRSLRMRNVMPCPVLVRSHIYFPIEGVDGLLEISLGCTKRKSRREDKAGLDQGLLWMRNMFVLGGGSYS